MRISVIVPTYNRAGLIGETLDSILGQSHKPEEVIVVDDGSTDDTEAIVRRYGPGVKYIRTQNAGAPSARNVGTDASTAPWIAYCDSDDLWLPGKLAAQARLLERAPEVEFAFTNSRTILGGQWSATTKFDELSPGFWTASRPVIEGESLVLSEPLFPRLLSEQPILVSTILLRRKFFERIGPWRRELGRVRSEDFEFSLRCAVHPNAGVISTPLVGIRKHASNFSGDLVATEMGEIEILNYVLKNHPAASRYEDAIREQIVVRSANVANAAFSAGQLDLVRGALQAVPPRRRDWKLHLKGWVSGLPGPVARGLARVLLKTAAAPRQV